MIDMPTPRTRPITKMIVGHGHHSECPGEEFRISVLFSYHPDEPYSVLMDITIFSENGSASKPWEVAREMLHAAVVWGTPSGIGDFRALPMSEDLMRLRLVDSMSCARDEKVFDMHLPRRPLCSFLLRTLNAVPAGSESALLDIDAELAELFA